MFDAMIKLILVCDRDAWGTNKAAHLAVYKVFLHFARCILLCNSNYKQCDYFWWNYSLAPSLSCMISAFTFANRLYHVSSDKMAKRAFIELSRLHEQGFTTWMTKLLDLTNDYSLDINQIDTIFSMCKMVVIYRLISNWQNNLINTEINPSLRTYQTIKKSYRLEPYLYKVKEAPFPNAIVRVRLCVHVYTLLLDIRRLNSIMFLINLVLYSCVFYHMML